MDYNDRKIDAAKKLSTAEVQIQKIAERLVKSKHVGEIRMLKKKIVKLSQQIKRWRKELNGELIF